jgi:hypothetical protein
MEEPDDGLLARLLWCWPDPVAFDTARRALDIAFAIRSLDRLRSLEMHDNSEGTMRRSTCRSRKQRGRAAMTPSLSLPLIATLSTVCDFRRFAARSGTFPLLTLWSERMARTS